jgi:hypothetical protein
MEYALTQCQVELKIAIKKRSNVMSSDSNAMGLKEG